MYTLPTALQNTGTRNVRSVNKKMKKTLIHLITLVLVQGLNAQFFCLADKKFEINQLALKAGISANLDVSFDVENYKAINIHIQPNDSLLKKITKAFVNNDSLSIVVLMFFEEVTRQNLSKITFLKDTVNVKWNIEYLVLSPRILNNDYAEAVSERKIRFVFKRPGILTHEHIIYSFVDSDTLILPAILKYKEKSVRESDILVERIFADGKDSTVVVRNNHPQLINEILKVSKSFTKERFTDIKPEARHYFIRFKIVRAIEKCGYQETY